MGVTAAQTQGPLGVVTRGDTSSLSGRGRMVLDFGAPCFEQPP